MRCALQHVAHASTSALQAIDVPGPPEEPGLLTAAGCYQHLAGATQAPIMQMVLQASVLLVCAFNQLAACHEEQSCISCHHPASAGGASHCCKPKCALASRCRMCVGTEC